MIVTSSGHNNNMTYVNQPMLSVIVPDIVQVLDAVDCFQYTFLAFQLVGPPKNPITASSISSYHQHAIKHKTYSKLTNFL